MADPCSPMFCSSCCSGGQFIVGFGQLLTGQPSCLALSPHVLQHWETYMYTPRMCWSWCLWGHAYSLGASAWMFSPYTPQSDSSEMNYLGFSKGTSEIEHESPVAVASLITHPCVAFSHSLFNNSGLSFLLPGIASKINYLHANCWFWLKDSVRKHFFVAPCSNWLPQSSPNPSMLKLERLRASYYTWGNWASKRLRSSLWSHSWIEADVGVELCSSFFG